MLYKKIAIVMVVFFILLIIATHCLLSVANNKRINAQLGKNAFPKTKSGRKIIWRLRVSYLIEFCGIALMNFLFVLA